MSTEAQKKWYIANRSRLRAAEKEYAKTHREAARARTKAWQNRNREMVRAKHREWSKSPEGRKWYQARDHARRAAKLARTINPKSIDLFISLIRSKKRVKCYYCKKWVGGSKAHIDHIVPLSKGGPHSVENLCATCPHCNQTKSSKLLHEYVKLGQQLLAL